MESPRGLVKGLNEDEWRTLRTRGMHWSLTEAYQVRLKDPTSGREATQPTLKLAYDDVMTNR